MRPDISDRHIKGSSKHICREKILIGDYISSSCKNYVLISINTAVIS